MRKPGYSLVVSRDFDGHILRALVRRYPGGAPDLILQRIELGDEAEPERVVREVTVRHNALNTIDTATWSDEGLSFSEGTRRWFVRASSDAFSNKAIRED